jgi:hypothetical protein
MGFSERVCALLFRLCPVFDAGVVARDASFGFTSGRFVIDPTCRLEVSAFRDARGDFAKEPPVTSGSSDEVTSEISLSNAPCFRTTAGLANFCEGFMIRLIGTKGSSSVEGTSNSSR